MQRFSLMILLCVFTQINFAQPDPCGPNPMMTPTCLEACVICDIDGFTGRNTSTISGQGFSGFCTTEYNRMAYIAFIAGTENLEIEFTVTNCTINWGLEVGIFESFDCETFSPVTICDTDVQPNTTITLSNTVPLVVGQHYYLVMDGSNNDECDWTFSVVNGSTAVGNLTSSGVINGNPTTCPGLPTSYSTTGEAGAALYTWTVDGVQQGETTQSVDIVFPSDGIYELCVTAANVCDEAPPSCTTIVVSTPETLVLVETICDNDCYEVAGQEICDSGNYEFVIPLPNGCDSLIFLDLTVLPQAQATVDINLCVGEEFFIGTNPYAETGVFVDTILTAASCDSIVTLDLFMVECEIIGSTDFIPPVCHGEASGVLMFSVQNGTPPFTYVWEHITNPEIGGTGSTVLFADNEIPSVPAGIYEINIMDDFGNNVVLFQEVTEPPVLTVTMEAIPIDGFNLSCHGGMDGTAIAFGNGGVPPYSFEWSDMQLGNQANNLSVGVHNVSITDAQGCVKSNEIVLTEPPPIQFMIDFINPNCDGFETGQVELDSIWGGTMPYTYALEDGIFSTISSYQDLSAGPYTFFIRDDNGCEADTMSSLIAPDIPILNMGEDLVVDLGCDILIPVQTNNTNLVDITWTDLDNSLDCYTCLRPYANPLDDASYVLTVTSVDDCSTSDSIRVVVNDIRDVFVPNAFSPNNDGINDHFFVYANKSAALVQSMRVFNRWGALVYEETNHPPNDLSIGWDGSFKGKKVDTGVYTWIADIEYLDGEVIQFSGDVLLIR